jgi:predicted RNA-binding protein Jag
VSELREFIAETEAEAVKRASEFFGVDAGSLELLVPPKSFEVGGLEPRVLVLAQVSEPPAELGEAGIFVTGILDRLGLDHPMRVEERVDGEWTVVRLSGRAGSWIRRQPGLEESLSHLAERIVQKADPGRRARVEIEEDGSRRREPRHGDGPRGRGGEREGRRGERGRGRGGPRGERRSEDRPGLSPEQEARLEDQARAAARSVLASGEPEFLPAMSSRERWVIHNALKDERGVRSESVGEGRERRVKIALA